MAETWCRLRSHVYQGLEFFRSLCVTSSSRKTTSKSFVTKGEVMQQPLWLLWRHAIYHISYYQVYQNIAHPNAEWTQIEENHLHFMMDGTFLFWYFRHMEHFMLFGFQMMKTTISINFFHNSKVEEGLIWLLICTSTCAFQRENFVKTQPCIIL